MNSSQFSELSSQLQRGQSLIELLIAIGIMSILLPALITGLVASREGKAQQKQRFEAVTMLKEAQEAVRSVREKGWNSFAVNGTFHPEVSGSSWVLVAGSQTINGFTRSVVISDVQRNTSGVIVTSGGTLDPSTKKVVTTISWGLPFTSSINATMYLTRFLDSASYIETTQTQFNAGTKTGVTVRATTPPSVADDGEILLGSGGYSDWCTPTLLSPGLDLPGSGIAKGVTAIEGKAFTGTGENASGLSFIQVNIDNQQPPNGPNATLGGTFDGYKTNDVFGETNYGYIATDTNAKEVVIINIPGFTEAGYFDGPGPSDGTSVFVTSSYGYVTTGNNLYNFNKVGGSLPIDADGVDLGGSANQVYIVGNYAYVSTSNASRELQIVDISNPSNLTVIGWVDMNVGVGRDVYVRSDERRAYVAAAASDQAELFIVNVENKTSPQVVSSYEANGMDPTGVTVVPGNRAVLVGTGGEEYQVIDISNENTPVRCGGTQIDVGALGVASVLESDGDAYSYIVNGDASAEFRIVIGGPGGAFVTSGEFESATFNPGYQTANNRFTATFSEPAGTDLQFQVSMANLVGGVCPSTGGYTFVGPDGTSSTRFNQASGQPVTFPFGTYVNYTNPGQCIRYKAYFSTTTPGNTPVLNDVTINYSP